MKARYLLPVFLSFLVFTSCQNSTASEETLAVSTTMNPVDGVWQIVEASYTQGEELKWHNVDRIQPSLFHFQAGFYSKNAIDSGQPRPSMEEGATLRDIPEETLRAIAQVYVSHAGNYELDGSTIIMKPVVALQTNLMKGATIEWEYKLEDERLSISRTNVYGQGGVVTLVLERLA